MLGRRGLRERPLSSRALRDREAARPRLGERSERRGHRRVGRSRRLVRRRHPPRRRSAGRRALGDPGPRTTAASHSHRRVPHPPRRSRRCTGPLPRARAARRPAPRRRRPRLRERGRARSSGTMHEIDFRLASRRHAQPRLGQLRAFQDDHAKDHAIRDEPPGEAHAGAVHAARARGPARGLRCPTTKATRPPRAPLAPARGRAPAHRVGARGLPATRRAGARRLPRVARASAPRARPGADVLQAPSPPASDGVSGPTSTWQRPVRFEPWAPAPCPPP